MPVAFGPQSVLCQLIWESANFASGGGTTTLGFNCADASTFDLGAFATDVSDAWQTAFRAVTDSDVTLDRIRIETNDRSIEAPVALAGTLNLTGPAPNTSVLFSYKGFGKGPRNRGRSYWPGLIAEGAVDERGVVNPSTVVGLFGNLTTFIEACEASPEIVGQAIVQSTYPGQKTPPQNPWPSVVSRTVGALVATQRRRLRP